MYPKLEGRQHTPSNRYLREQLGPRPRLRSNQTHATSICHTGGCTRLSYPADVKFVVRLPTDVATGHSEPGDEGGWWATSEQANKRRAGERSHGGGTGREYRIVSPDAIMAGGGLWCSGSAEVGAAVEWNRAWDVLDVVVLDGLVDVERWSVGEAVLSNVMPLMADIHET